MRLPAGITPTPSTQHNRSGAFGQQGFQQYSPSQAQPQQQSQGTPYNPQQGGNFSAWSPQPQARRVSESAWGQMYPNTPYPTQNTPEMQAIADQGFLFRTAPPPTSNAQMPQWASQMPMGGQNFGIPPFQFRATDFMGNQYSDPNAFTAQQGAMAQALNQQRAGQINNMHTQGTPLTPLNPQMAYNQGMQMLQGGFQNPFMNPSVLAPQAPPQMYQPTDEQLARMNQERTRLYEEEQRRRFGSEGVLVADGGPSQLRRGPDGRVYDLHPMIPLPDDPAERDRFLYRGDDQPPRPSPPMPLPPPGYGTPPERRGGYSSGDEARLQRTRDWRDADKDGIDDRDQDGPGMMPYDPSIYRWLQNPKYSSIGPDRPGKTPAPQQPGTAQPIQPPPSGTPYDPRQRMPPPPRPLTQQEQDQKRLDDLYRAAGQVQDPETKRWRGTGVPGAPTESSAQLQAFNAALARATQQQLASRFRHDNAGLSATEKEIARMEAWKMTKGMSKKELAAMTKSHNLLNSNNLQKAQKERDRLEKQDIKSLEAQYKKLSNRPPTGSPELIRQRQAELSALDRQIREKKSARSKK